MARRDDGCCTSGLVREKGCGRVHGALKMGRMVVAIATKPMAAVVVVAVDPENAKAVADLSSNRRLQLSEQEQEEEVGLESPDRPAKAHGAAHGAR
jgi:D-arabinose 1-dehydrogenase-like Zn-dependent alcohol dehydrogenase